MPVICGALLVDGKVRFGLLNININAVGDIMQSIWIGRIAQ
jgi:hypothetical protein